MHSHLAFHFPLKKKKKTRLRDFARMSITTGKQSKLNAANAAGGVAGHTGLRGCLHGGPGPRKLHVPTHSPGGPSGKLYLLLKPGS